MLNFNITKALRAAGFEGFVVLLHPHPSEEVEPVVCISLESGRALEDSSGIALFMHAIRNLAPQPFSFWVQEGDRVATHKTLWNSKGEPENIEYMSRHEIQQTLLMFELEYD
jgi:hypothetical protein